MEYDDNEDATIKKSAITVTYNGIDYCGEGIDYLWTDTFADLQSKLPDGVRLACCMTCRHGNMCPYGNAENRLFCTKDLTITSKDDMCDLFDKTDPDSDRKVLSFDCCDCFVYQDDNYYTYNDYLFRFKQKTV